MKIVLTSKGQDWESEIDPRFGRTEFFFVYDSETKQTDIVDNRAVNDVAHGAGPMTARKLFDLKPDVLITGNGPGGNAARVLEQGNINIFVGAEGMTVKAALSAYEKNELRAF